MPCLPPADLPHPGIEPGSLAGSLPLAPPGKSTLGYEAWSYECRGFDLLPISALSGDDGVILLVSRDTAPRQPSALNFLETPSAKDSYLA